MNTKKVVTIGILTALATVLMFIEIPNPLVPFLKFDISDVAVLIVLALYGWKSASLTILLRGLLHAMIKGPDPYSAIPYLGNITAILASLVVISTFFVLRNRFGAKNVMTGIWMVLMLTFALTVFNYFVITPAYFGWPTVSLAEVKGMFTGFLSWDTGGSYDPSQGYFLAVLFAYVPFNLIKGTLVAVLYFLLEKPILKSLE